MPGCYWHACSSIGEIEPHIARVNNRHHAALVIDILLDDPGLFAGKQARSSTGGYLVRSLPTLNAWANGSPMP